MIGLTYAALNAAMESATGMSGKVFDSFRRSDDGALVRDLYVISYASAPIATRAGRYTGVPTWSDMVADFDYRIKFVGPTVDAVLALMDRAIPTVTGQTLTVTGRRNDPMSVTASGVVVPILEVRSPLYSGDIRVRFTSHPA